jgi:hypothetical protein
MAAAGVDAMHFLETVLLIGIAAVDMPTCLVAPELAGLDVPFARLCRSIPTVCDLEVAT